MGLREIIVWEGKASSMLDIPVEVLKEAQGLGYLTGLTAVLDLYKPGAKLRKKEGDINVNPTSLRFFHCFVEASELLAELATSPVVQALLLHGGASGSSAGNGNTGRQPSLNIRARQILLDVPKSEQSDDWWCVYEKVSVGLFESGAIEFDEAEFLRIIESMHNGRSKDTAGRRVFLARRYISESRWDDALALLEVGILDDYSAPNQKEELMKLHLGCASSR